MIDFYNAFISYRHAPLDSAIATHVQRKLEHFHVPHKLKKNLKRQKITRIFRDKDELPITSDLTETITEALEMADCLIVICSTNTKDSVWVKREIRTFLKTHTRDKVLTVLCDGEPFDVIPEELLKTEKEFTDANGFTHTVTVPVEPLSCDYRLPRSTADKEELPRLAAALLGCSYDELQRRNRQYRIRRTTAIVGAAFAALIGFGAYMAYTGKQINDNYIESLRARSTYLATEAEQLIDEGKRADALHLSIAALPNEDYPKMPVTASAVRAIIDATCAFQTNHGAYFTPIWNYKTDKSITHFINTENCNRIAAMDKTGNVYCWDSATHELLLHIYGDSDECNIIFIDDDTLLVVHSDHLEAYNVPSNTHIWSYAPETRICPFREADVVCANHSVFFTDDDGYVIKLSGRDGSVMNTYDVRGSSLLSVVSCLTVSPDGKKLAYADSNFIFSENDMVHIYDTETGMDYSNHVDSYLIWKMMFTTDGHLFVAATDDVADMSLAFSDVLTYVTDSSTGFFCFDEKMNSCWSADMDFSDLPLTVSIMEIPSRGAVLYSTGDTATIYDIRTGEVKNLYKTGNAIMKVDDFNYNGLPEFICRQGDYVFAVNESTNDLAKYSTLDSNIIFGATGDQLFTVRDEGTDIICYSRFLQDDEWTGVSAYGGYITGSAFQTSCAEDDTLVIAARVNDTKDVRISVIDLNEGELVFSEDLPNVEKLVYNLRIEFFEDQFYAILGYDIYLIDLEDQTVEKTDIHLETGTYETNGKIVTLDISHKELTVSVMDLDGSLPKEFKPFDLGEDGFGSFAKGAYYVESLDTVFFPINDSLYYADLSSSKIKEIELPDNWSTSGVTSLTVSASEDGSRICFTDGMNLLVTNSSYEELFSFRLNCNYRYSSTFRNDTLYVISDNTLSLFDASSGEIKNRYEIGLYGIGEAVFHFDDKNHQLFIQIDDQISIFDTTSWVEMIYIESVYCYHQGSNRFYVCSYQTDSECSIGYIKNYSLDELIEKAKTLLAGQELSVDFRSKYGI